MLKASKSQGTNNAPHEILFYTKALGFNILFLMVYLILEIQLCKDVFNITLSTLKNKNNKTKILNGGNFKQITNGFISIKSK